MCCFIWWHVSGSHSLATVRQSTPLWSVLQAHILDQEHLYFMWCYPWDVLTLFFSPPNFSSLRFFRGFFVPWICWPHILNQLCFQLAHLSVYLYIFLSLFAVCCICTHCSMPHIHSLFVIPQFPILSIERSVVYQFMILWTLHAFL